MSVARAREWVARCRAAGIVVHELDGCYSRGNGQSSAYEGWSNHHTATAFGMAPPVLWQGRPDLSPPLCNSAGNADGSCTLVAAHPANHAGASGGWDTAPLPRTSVFNKLMWGHEIVYPGTVPMTAAQYRTALIVSKIGVDIWGYGDVNRIKFHQGTSITGKWDPGYALGKTYSIQEFRAAAAAGVPPEVGDVNLSDKIRAWDGFEITVGQALFENWQLINNLSDRPTRPNQPADATPWVRQAMSLLTAILAAVTNDPDLTAEQIAKIVRDNSVDTAALAAQLLGPLQETLSGLDSVSPEDAEQIAQATARKFAEQLGADLA